MLDIHHNIISVELGIGNEQNIRGKCGQGGEKGRQ